MCVNRPRCRRLPSEICKSKHGVGSGHGRLPIACSFPLCSLSAENKRDGRQREIRNSLLPLLFLFDSASFSCWMRFCRSVNCSNKSVGPENEETFFLTAAVNQLLGGSALFTSARSSSFFRCFAARKIYGCLSERFRRSHLPQPWEMARSLYFSWQFWSSVGGQPTASLTARADGDAKCFPCDNHALE